MKNKTLGFTLIEMVIAVAIIGILSAIAIPGYKQYLIKGKRAEAQGALVSFANAMEQWRLQNAGSYCDATGVGNGCVAGAPTIFSQTVPVSGGKTTYNLTINASTATTYTLRATPVGAQAEDGYLDITEAGVKTCEKATACLNGTSW